MWTKSWAVALASAITLPAFAGVQTWDFSGQTLQGSGYSNYINMTSGDGVNLNVSGWSDTNGTSHVSTPETIEGAQIAYYSGALGLINQDEDAGVPDQSIDSFDANAYGDDYDMILLEFSSAISLTGFSIGWAQEGSTLDEADISLLAYTGNNYTVIAGETWNSLVNGGGWVSEKNFSNVSNYSTVNYQSAQNTYSNYWLIGAYNATFGNDNFTVLDDGFELAGVTSKTRMQLPEPGTFVLLISGLMGISVRRKCATGKG